MRENLNKRNNLFTVIGQTPSPKSCEHNRRIFPDGMTWEHECNSCTCDNGKVRCTKVNFFLLFAHVRVFVFYRSPLFVCLCVWKRCTLDKDTGRTVPCDLDLAGLRKLFPPPLHRETKQQEWVPDFSGKGSCWRMSPIFHMMCIRYSGPRMSTAHAVS